MSGTRNTVAIIKRDGVERWPDMSKDAVAERLVALIVQTVSG